MRRHKGDLLFSKLRFFIKQKKHEVSAYVHCYLESYNAAHRFTTFRQNTSHLHLKLYCFESHLAL